MKAVGMENCETLEEIWMILSSNVLSKESPMFGGSNGCRTILDNCDKSKNLFEQHWTLDGQYRPWTRVGYISPAIGGVFIKP